MNPLTPTIRKFYSTFAGRVAAAGSVMHCLLILAIGITIYANTFNAPFLLDGIGCITENPAISTFFDRSIPHYQKYAGVEPDIINSMKMRPFTYLTFALNYRVHGFNLTGYHLVNLCIHLTAALLTYALTSQFLTTPFFSDHPGIAKFRRTLPLLVGLLFVCHPIQTTAVTYIVQRFTSMATLFYLCSLLLYLRARNTEKGKIQLAYLSCSVAVAALGMYTKEIVFTLPTIAVLCEIFFLRGRLLTRIKFLSPLLGTMLIIPFNMYSITVAASGAGNLLESASNLGNLTNVSRWDYFFTQFRVMVTYLRLLVLPVNQHLDYDYPVYHLFLTPPVLMSALFLFCVVLSGVWAYYQSLQKTPVSWGLRLIAFGIAWFFTTIAPSSSIIPLDDMIFEHNLYLPSFGFFLAVTAIMMLVRQRLEARGINTGSWAVPGVALIILSLSIATFSRNHVYGTAVRFWEDNVAKAPQKARPHHNLGVAYGNESRFSEAVDQNLHAITLEPNYLSWLNLAIYLSNLGRNHEALAAYEEALGLRPLEYQVRLRYSKLLAMVGRRVEAEEQIRIVREAALSSINSADK